MNTAERRKYPRFVLSGVAATVTFNQFDLPAYEMNGEVIDMSYNGIKIHLHEPLIEKLDGYQISIRLILPESGIPLTIRGILKHQLTNSDYGFYYEEHIDEAYLDEFVLECTKTR